MTHSFVAKSKILVFLAVVTLSSVTMLWLFWHHPVTTSLATLAVLTALGVSARLARSLEGEGASEVWPHDQGIRS